MLLPNGTPNGVFSDVLVVVPKTFVGFAEDPPNMLPTCVLVALLNIEVDPNVFCPNAVVVLGGIRNLLEVILTMSKCDDELNSSIEVVVGVPSEDVSGNTHPEVIGTLRVLSNNLLLVVIPKADDCMIVFVVVSTPNMGVGIEDTDENIVGWDVVTVLNNEGIVLLVTLFPPNITEVVVTGVHVVMVLLPGIGACGIPNIDAEVEIGSSLNKELAVQTVILLSKPVNAEDFC